MHDDRGLITERIRRTVSDRLRPAVFGDRRALEVTAWEVPGEPIPVGDARAALAAGSFSPFGIGQPWGKPWGTVWFRLQGEVPPGWRGETVQMIVDFFTGVGAGFQGEGLLFRTDAGGPIRGIHPFHQAVPIDLVAGDDGDVDVLIEAAANPTVATSYRPTPLGDLATAGDTPQYRLNTADLAVRNDAAYHLDLDLQILTGLVRELPDDDERQWQLLRAIDRALDALDPHDVAGTADGARAALEPVLARPGTPHRHRISAVGHAHIDSAWLWPLRETRRKCARTFSSAVTLMDAYPEYRFACSQAAQYDWIEADHPELFERIRDKVAAGRFIPVGSMWVEADTNLPSGESLARQFVWGKRYFADRFDVETTELWLPDVFGYAGNLPQIMAAAGCDAFLTQKLSWNKTNTFPHHTFWWEGIDGTRVLSHFPPADTYNGEVRADELIGAARRFRDRGAASRSMYLFGHGDGGGGPTREMLERARRVTDLDGYPRLAIEAPSEFFAAARDEYPDAPVWRGELYFEMHRGTYTSQAKTKAGNRRCELALRELEVWTALGGAPLGDLERWWKEVLLHQFHDIIPGSSIAWVHDDTEEAHARVLAEVNQALAADLGRHAAALADQPLDERNDRSVRRYQDPPTERSSRSAGAGVLVVANAGPFDYTGVVDTPTGPRFGSVPAFAASEVGLDFPGDHGVSGHWSNDEYLLWNGLVEATIDGQGHLVSLKDLRTDRESLAGPGNVLQLFPDHPDTYDAWDVEAHTLALDPEIIDQVDSIEIVEDGPLAAGIRVTRRFGLSTIIQTYRLRAGSARLDIITDVDWHENERLLKAAFPLAVRADDARYDVQYGHVRRPTHRNTSWDAAKFEVCGHMWADVSEPDFGVAILNDSKYGYDCIGDRHSTTMRLSLLRAPNYPDPDADRGHHRFTYSVLPHGPGLGEVIREAWALNLPPRPAAQPRDPIIRVDNAAVVVTAVKAADDGSGDVIVRYHEAFGGRVAFQLEGPAGFTTASRCDLLERPLPDGEADVRLDDGRPVVNDQLRPFQLETLRFTR